MLKIAICDDEDFYRNKAEKLVGEYLENKDKEYCTDMFADGKSLLNSKLPEYDIIFLDINMDDIDGIETAKKIREVNSSVFIVFITAFMDYATQGYMVNAIRYILKDMMEVMLPEALDTIIKKLCENQSTVTYTFISGEQTLYTDKIIWIESRGHKLFFKMSGRDDEDLCFYGKLDEIENDMNKYGFIRAHKSYMVNVKYIKKISGYDMYFQDGSYITISRTNLQNVKAKYLRYKGEM